MKITNNSLTIPQQKIQKFNIARINQYDSFEMTTSPAFKGAKQKIAQDILKHHQNGFGEYVGTALAAFAKKMENASPAFLGSILAGAFASLHLIANNEEVEELVPENTLETLITGIKDEPNQENITESIESSEIIEDTKTTEIADKENTPKSDLVTIAFPKKHGKLSKSQAFLKEIVEITEVPKEYAEKLTSICKQLLIKGEYKYQNETLNNDILAQRLSEDLADYCDNPVKIIEDYYQICESNIENDKDAQLASASSQEIKTNDSPTDSSSAENEVVPKQEITTRTKQETSTEVTTPALNKELAETKATEAPVKKAKRPRINSIVATSTSSGSVSMSSENYRPPQGLAFRPNGSFNLADNDSTIYTLRQNLNRIEKGFKNWYPSSSGVNVNDIIWLNGYSVPNTVTDRDIKNELNRYNSDQKRPESSQPYKQLNQNNAGGMYNTLILILADVLSDVEEFQNYFTLHGALRFIDRFINIDNAGYKLEVIKEECKAKIKILLDNIIKTATHGTTIEPYTSVEKYIGARMYLLPELYDDPAQKLFGSSVAIGFAGKWDGTRVHNWVIHTVFNR